MKKTITALTLGLLSLGSIIYAPGASGQRQNMSSEQKLRYAARIIEKYYVDTVDNDHVAESAIRAMLKTLDPHSLYSDAEETRQLTEPLQGNFSGIGIQFNMLNDTLFVIQPVVGGPSEKVGIQAGDRILRADTTVISGVKKKNTDIQKVLRGPKGSKITLLVKRRGVEDPISFRVTRDDIPLLSVDAFYMAAPGIGYIKISKFAETTVKEVEEALKSLRKKGMTDLIIDLQYNGGGYLNAACEIADMFLRDGDMIVYTEGDKVPRSDFRAGRKTPFEQGRVVVMVDQNSASASEILSGALQDHDRGVIVGRRTFGKGLVQRPFPFPDGTMIRLTVARYYTPSGRCIQKPYAEGEEDAYELDIVNRYKSGELTNADSIHANAGEKFSTLRTGRTVYGGGGIMPDVFVPIDTTTNSDYSRDVLAKGVYNQFCASYVDTHRKEIKRRWKSEDDFVDSFEVTDAMMADFRAMAQREGVEFDSEGYERSLPFMKTVIKALIGRDVYSESTYYRVVNPTNETYVKALEIITDHPRYQSILSGSLNRDKK